MHALRTDTRLLRHLDVDGDGRISTTEFQTLIEVLQDIATLKEELGITV